RIRTDSELAAEPAVVVDLVTRVDLAGVGVRPAVELVVARHAVPRLQEVVAGLVGRALGRVRSVEPEVIVSLAAVELVVLSGALDEAVVLLALDHVGAVSAAGPGGGAACCG